VGEAPSGVPVDPCELEGECAAGSDECGAGEEEEVWISLFEGKDEEVWAVVILLAGPDADAGKAELDGGCALVVFSKMSFCAPSWKLYKSW